MQYSVVKASQTYVLRHLLHLGPVYSFLQLNSKSGELFVAGEAAEVAALLPATVAVAATQYDNQVLQYSTVQYSILQFRV